MYAQGVQARDVGAYARACIVLCYNYNNTNERRKLKLTSGSGRLADPMGGGRGQDAYNHGYSNQLNHDRFLIRISGSRSTEAELRPIGEFEMDKNGCSPYLDVYCISNEKSGSEPSPYQQPLSCVSRTLIR